MIHRRDLLKAGTTALAASAISSVSAAPVPSAPASTSTRGDDVIRIEFTLFSAFYSPLIATIAGGFLQRQGLKPVYAVSAPGRTAIASLQDGSAHVVQTAPSQAFNDLEKGRRPQAVHFAQINERDGFFLAGREADPAFDWRKLRGKRVLVTPGVQPTTMFKYACFKGGLEVDDLEIVDAGPPAAMVAAFRAGQGDYIHLQGPSPQQLEHDGAGRIVASLAGAVGPCAFSSLAARRDWLSTDQARAFMRAYREACAWLLATPAAEVAVTQARFFGSTDPAVLAATIEAYQHLGNWNREVEISRASFDATVDIFRHAGLISRRYAYEDVVAPPPRG